MTTTTPPLYDPATSPRPVPGTLIWADPGADPTDVLLADNLRTNPRIDAAFAASVQELGILQPVAATLTAGGQVRVRLGSRRTAAAIQTGLLSIPEATGSHGGVYGHGEVAAAITKASPKRAELIAVGIVVGAWEDALDDMAWRRSPGEYPDPRTYLAHLTGWGYEPSDIERAVINGEAWGTDKDWSK